MSSPLTEWLERHQIPIYLAGLAAGAAVGAAWPAGEHAWEAAIYPVLGALLYATFLQVPFTKLTAAFREVRFLAAVLGVNFIVVPLVVAALTTFVSMPQAVLLGVLLTLLTPCIDYVIVFCGLAGGDNQRLLAAAPLLMLIQMLALPLLLWLFVGPELADIVDVGPFLEAFLILIVAPLLLAWATEGLAMRHRSGQVISSAMAAAMVPLMTATLFVVVASQFPKISHQVDQVLKVVPIYAAFLLIMALLGLAVVRLLRFDSGRGRALIFSGATRNSLVVLPLALALPAAYATTPAIVVTQTLVELLGMIIYVRVVPKLILTHPADG
ncbi:MULTISPECIES: arsenic resistance protein [Mycobacteriaceae]|uniref:Sodium Bile acid symporter family protein n=3 Tax=Mycolicibacterium TaxID=1866885 RepID=A0A0H5RZ76_9MYCO|nr:MULTISPECIES: bile acid:sodium symporter [Mycobacteriaceae]NOP95084.1 arsenic resistance protein [Mycolicibacterium fortuitum]EIC71231.1 bile acid:sodium symporter [Mycobacteroides abscessus M94]MBN7365655.1 arsenic resistance protein [Mycobacteroides abscessus subsp. abscessus]MBN7455374.1 arsenic resistance protein [Mycobacteroides abscessus subsp. abscessus]MBN7490844.1 arsenic resistance protein [Mycobacteroides abscessus subsp. abscessus]